MADTRTNFRASYLEKVGIRGVDEKSLEILLSEQPCDIERLKHFCLRVPYPARYRLEVWKLVLDVVPPYLEIHEFVMRQRTEQYMDLKNAVIVMGRCKESTPLPELHLQMSLLHRGILPFSEQQMSEKSSAMFLATAASVLESVEDHQMVDAYWITHKFFLLVWKNSTEMDKQVMLEQLEHIVQKEDANNQKHVLEHIRKIDGGVSLLYSWMNTSFAGLLPGNSHERLWDKILGGSTKILCSMTASVLMTFRSTFVALKSLEDIRSTVAQMDEVGADAIVTKAVDLMYKYHGAS